MSVAIQREGSGGIVLIDLSAVHLYLCLGEDLKVPSLLPYASLVQFKRAVAHTTHV